MSNLAYQTDTADTATVADDDETIRPIPRISIQAFCETSDVHAVMADAFEDRRMGKAHRTAQMGGVAAAVEFYGGAPTPNLIVIETSADAGAIKMNLDRLADVCDPGTRVVVIGHVNDVILYRDLIRRGVSEYVVAPITPLQIIKTISETFTAPDAEPVGRSIAFVGARGGTGSSTVAHNVAWAISNDLDTEVAIADLDLAFGTAALDFNQDPVQGLSDAVFDTDRVDEQLMERILFRCTDKLGLYAAPATLERNYDLPESAYQGILDVMRNSVPVAVLDVPHVWTGWARETLRNADEIVITAAPDLASLRNAKNMVEVLTELRRHDAAPRLVLNTVGMPKRPEIGTEDFEAALGLETIATIPFEPQLFGVASNNGQMIAEASANAKPVETFLEIAKIITGRGEHRRAKRSPLSTLLGHLSLRKKSGGE